METWHLVRDDQQIHIVAVAICLITFGVHTNILCIIKVNGTLVFIKWSYKSPDHVIVERRMVSIVLSM